MTFIQKVQTISASEKPLLISLIYVGLLYILKEYEQILRNLTYANRVKSSFKFSFLSICIAYILLEIDNAQSIFYFLALICSYHASRFTVIIYLNQNQKHFPKVGIVGAGSLAHAISVDPLVKQQYYIKFFFTCNKAMIGRLSDDKKIYNFLDLQKHLTELDGLIVANDVSDDIPPHHILDLKDQLADQKLFLKFGVGNSTENLNTKVVLQDFSFENFVKRSEEVEILSEVISNLQNKNIFVSGAGGSIGKVLSKILVEACPATLFLVDHDETSIFELTQSFKEYPDIVTIVLGDIKDKNLLKELFKSVKFDFVFHCAAYKHVSIFEQNICVGLYNNILATKNLLEVADTAKVEKFVHISTDKAVRPTNWMGVSKLLCELVVKNFSQKHTIASIVRFGNVFGSSGSVVPRFKSQIESGGPVTVSHPDVTRYFMSISEACYLILNSTHIAANGDIFVLDMGQPIKIVQLAKLMIEYFDQDKKTEIIFTGLGKGEKMHEELAWDHELTPTEVNKLLKSNDEVLYPQIDNDYIEFLLKNLKKHNHSEVKNMINHLLFVENI